MIVRCACGVPIIGYRTTWATPTCVGCLPPPPPLPINLPRSMVARDRDGEVVS